MKNILYDGKAGCFLKATYLPYLANPTGIKVLKSFAKETGLILEEHKGYGLVKYTLATKDNTISPRTSSCCSIMAPTLSTASAYFVSGTARA